MILGLCMVIPNIVVVPTIVAVVVVVVLVVAVSVAVVVVVVVVIMQYPSSNTIFAWSTQRLLGIKP